jgi:hypothetical protein
MLWPSTPLSEIYRSCCRKWTIYVHHGSQRACTGAMNWPRIVVREPLLEWRAGSSHKHRRQGSINLASTYVWSLAGHQVCLMSDGVHTLFQMLDRWDGHCAQARAVTLSLTAVQESGPSLQLIDVLPACLLCVYTSVPDADHSFESAFCSGLCCTAIATSSGQYHSTPVGKSRYASD